MLSHIHEQYKQFKSPMFKPLMLHWTHSVLFNSLKERTSLLRKNITEIGTKLFVCDFCCKNICYEILTSSFALTIS